MALYKYAYYYYYYYYCNIFKKIYSSVVKILAELSPHLAIFISPLSRGNIHYVSKNYSFYMLNSRKK